MRITNTACTHEAFLGCRQRLFNGALASDPEVTRRIRNLFTREYALEPFDILVRDNKKDTQKYKINANAHQNTQDNLCNFMQASDENIFKNKSDYSCGSRNAEYRNEYPPE